MARKPMGAAAVILDQQGRVLLVKHTYGKLNWELPGGASEAEESVAGTAVREVLEETGLRVVAERMVGRVYYDPGYDMHHFVFVCGLAGDALSPCPSSPEIGELGYFAVDDLPRPISDFTVRRIRDAVGGSLEPGVVEIGPRVWLE